MTRCIGLISLLLVVACASTRTSISADYRPGEYRNISVVDWESSGPFTGTILFELEMGLSELGYKLVSRDRLSSLLEAQGFNLSRLTKESAKEVGRLENVDAILFARVQSRQKKSGVSSVGLECDLIDLESGTIVFKARGTSGFGSPNPVPRILEDWPRFVAEAQE